MAGPEDQLTPDVLCKASPQWWAALRRGMARTQFHDELHTLLLEHNRVCILAPRSHGKSEAVVNHVAWRCWRQPGLTVMVFSATENLASKLKRRVDAAVEEAQPAMMPRRPPSDSATTFTNGSVLEAAGTGVSTRGLHPDLIIGDDVLTEDSARSASVRRYLHDWWYGSVLGMPHSGITRTVKGRRVTFGPTAVGLLGTPFHQADLLLGAKKEPTVGLVSIRLPVRP